MPRYGSPWAESTRPRTKSSAVDSLQFTVDRHRARVFSPEKKREEMNSFFRAVDCQLSTVNGPGDFAGTLPRAATDIDQAHLELVT